MGIGKYSPTVHEWYRLDQEWWHKNGGEGDFGYDKDGYDAYGYNEQDVDRAGNEELSYAYMDEDEFENLKFDWDKKPAPSVANKLAYKQPRKEFEKVERFDPELDQSGCWGDYEGGCPSMTKSEDGCWVSHDDYKKLLDAYKKLTT